MLALLLLACSEPADSGEPAPLPPFEDTALDDYELAIDGDASVFGDLMALDAEPMVMVNLIRFRDQAVVEGFEGLTGPEAYQQYTDAIAETQDEIGTRLILVGEIGEQVVGSSDPLFQILALPAYTSVSAFLQLAQSITDEASAARAAGLEGQWAIAAATVSEDDSPLGDGAGCTDWTADDAAAATGLSEAQVQRLLASPAGQPVTIFELVRTRQESGDIEAWLDALARVQDELGARRRWRGELLLQVLGTADPGFDQVLTTEYPSPGCYLTALADERVTSLAQARVDGTEIHWIYTANTAESELWPGSP